MTNSQQSSRTGRQIGPIRRPDRGILQVLKWLVKREPHKLAGKLTIFCKLIHYSLYTSLCIVYGYVKNLESESCSCGDCRVSIWSSCWPELAIKMLMHLAYMCVYIIYVDEQEMQIRMHLWQASDKTRSLLPRQVLCCVVQQHFACLSSLWSDHHFSFDSRFLAK